MNQSRRLRRRCSPTPAPRGGYGAAPPASRVANALAARRACGPPLTPEPLRPLTRKRCGQGGALPATLRGAQHQQSRSNPYKSSLYGFRGLPGRIDKPQRRSVGAQIELKASSRPSITGASQAPNVSIHVTLPVGVKCRCARNSDSEGCTALESSRPEPRPTRRWKRRRGLAGSTQASPTPRWLSRPWPRGMLQGRRTPARRPGGG
jgi:hypothetical protein